MTVPDARLGRLLDNGPLIIGGLLLVDSLHFIFARLLVPYLPPETSALFVLGVATVEIGLAMAISRQIRLAVLRRYLWFFLSIGLLVAASTSLNYAAVAFIDPGTASLVGKMSVVFGLALAVLWLRERLQAREWAGSLLALAGAVLISFQPGDLLRLGSLLVLLSTFLYALHAAIVKRYGGEIDIGNFFLFRVASTTFFLLLIVFGRGGWQWPGGPAWLVLILAGSVDVVISRLLYYLALRRLQLSYHTVILTLSPVVTILWSLLLFGTQPSAQGWLGGTAVIAGVLIVSAGQRASNQHRQGQGG